MEVHSGQSQSTRLTCRLMILRVKQDPGSCDGQVAEASDLGATGLRDLVQVQFLT